MAAGETRVVLTWDSAPADLDAHLTGPSVLGSRFHIFWNNKTDKNAAGTIYAGLDRDDRDSYGPETITISTRLTGTYHYYVHDFTNAAATTGSTLAASGATVKVYTIAGLQYTFHVPNQAGNFWHVFDLDGTTLTPVNAMSFSTAGAPARTAGDDVKGSENGVPPAHPLP